MPLLSTGGRVPAGFDYAVHLWDMTGRQEFARFEGHTSAVQGVAFAHEPATNKDMVGLQLAPLMQPLGADAGFLFDADSDRVAFATEDGMIGAWTGLWQGGRSLSTSRREPKAFSSARASPVTSFGMQNEPSTIWSAGLK